MGNGGDSNCLPCPHGLTDVNDMINVTDILTIAREAGEKILQVYRQEFTVTDKADQSPLTEADLQAHRHIVARLQKLTPDVPVLSEESSAADTAQRMSWARYWLVDPLDGTKEFIQRNGEFTVNIALIDNGEPVLGVVHAPVLDTSWWGEQGKGAHTAQGNGPARPIHVAPVPGPGQTWRVVGSRSHATPEQAAESAQVTPWPTAEIEDAPGLFSFDMTQQGGNVLAYVMVARALAKILGAALVVGQGESADLREFVGAQGHGEVPVKERIKTVWWGARPEAACPLVDGNEPACRLHSPIS